MTAALQSEEPSRPGKTALLVDPDPSIRQMLSTVFEPAGWVVRTAQDNKAALTLVRETPIDLIVTGEKTSAKEDVDLLREIRRVRPHTRMIILTDDSTPEDVIASMREHAFGYFSRPISLESLAETVGFVLKGPCWDDGIEVLSATPTLVSLAVRCDVRTADRLLVFLAEIADLPQPEKRDVGMAFREMMLNAIEHGGHFDPEQYIEITYVRARRMVMCRVKDPGEGFSLDEIQHAAISNPADDPTRHMAHRDALGMRPGGYGVLIARKLLDELIYGEKGNEVLLVKYLPSN